MAAKTKKSATTSAKKAASVVAQSISAPVAKPVSTAPVVPVAKPNTPVVKSVPVVERQKMIEVAAYVLAEKNGFKGDAQQYWLQAEKNVDAKLGKR